MPSIIKHSELSMLVWWRSTLLFLLKSNWHGEHPKYKDWFAIANWILSISRRPNPCLFVVICSYVRSWAYGPVYVLNNEGQRAGIFEYLSLFAFLQLDIFEYVEHVISKVNQSTCIQSRVYCPIMPACLLYSSSPVLLVFDHADTVRQTAGKIDRYSSCVACPQSLACAHVFCRLLLFVLSPRIRGNSRSIKLGYFMCKSYLPVLTLLLNLRPHLKN